MTLVFEPIRIERQEAYRRRLAACDPRASDYSFVNLWGWADAHGLEWAWDDDLVWIRQRLPAPCLWAPVGPVEGVDWPRALAKAVPAGGRLARVPAPLAEHWRAALGPRVQVTEARGHWDYLYDARALAALSGNRYHKKKNLVNQFRRAYDHTYEPLGPGTVAEALGMQTDWCTWRDCESVDALAAENQAIARVLDRWDDLAGIRGGLLRVDGRLVAYTVAERFAPDTLLIHFEKGNPDYKGAYQMINQAFLADAAGDVRWVNREQDLDDEGLRRAKLSYHPEDFVRKYEVRLG